MESDNYISEKIKVSGYEINRLIHKDLSSWFSIIPSYGSAINELAIDGRNILLSAKKLSEFSDNTIQLFSGTQLFPYPCRVKNAEYSFHGKHYYLPKNDSPREHSLHGLIYNKRFTVDRIDHEQGEIESSFIYDIEDEGFPFKVKIKNWYKLINNGLSIITSISNLGDEYFPYGHGWHPYFITYEWINDWFLQIPSVEQFVFDDVIPTGETKDTKDFINECRIGDRYIDCCFKISTSVIEEIPTQVTLVSPQRDKTIIIKVTGYNYLQVYTPPDRGSIALEPLTCIPDALNNQIGLQTLGPGASIDLGFEIRVENIQ